MRSIDIPPGALKVTRFKQYDDHPEVWEDYISSCGGDTGTGEYYITTADEEVTYNGGNSYTTKEIKRHIRVNKGDYIFDMPGGNYIVVPKPRKSSS
jgi:hypothetical protein